MEGIKSNVIIFSDIRESQTKLVEILKRECELTEQKLEVGDYMVSSRVCVERKTCADFLSSMMDGRLFSQLNDLKNNFESPVLVIEGDTLFQKDRKIHPNAIRGALSSIAIDVSVPIIWTRNQSETADMLIAMAKREQEPCKRHVNIRSKRTFLSPNQQMEFILAGLPNISTLTAKKLLKHFGSLNNVLNASETELQKVDGLGEKTAKNIRRILTKNYEKSILD